MRVIGYRAAGPDEQAAGNQSQVSIPVPAGVSDGDLLVAALAVAGGAAVSCTAPAGWTLRAKVPNEDGVHPNTLHVYTREAANEPPRWVWTISAAAPHSGVLAAYANVDRYQVIDAQATQITASGVAHPIPTLSVSEHGVRVVALLSAGVLTAATAPSGWVRRALATHANGGVETLALIYDRTIDAPGTTSAASVTLAAAGPGAALALALLPSVGTVSQDDAFTSLVDAMPAGSRDLYDVDPGNPDGFGPILAADAEIARIEGFDLVDTLRSESSPARARHALPSWEALLGLGDLLLARTGTALQRRAAVTSKLRESGASTIANIKAVIGPLLGYADPNALDVVECPRATLTAAHKYSNGTGGALVAPGSTTQYATVTDQPRVSLGGAILYVNAPALVGIGSLATVQVQGPASITYPQADRTWTWDLTVDDPTVFRMPEAALCELTGDWAVTFAVSGGTTLAWDSWEIAVEATARSAGFTGADGWGAAMHRWVVAYDLGLVGATHDPDWDGARRALDRIKPAHTVAYLVDVAAAVFDVAAFESATF